MEIDKKHWQTLNINPLHRNNKVVNKWQTLLNTDELKSLSYLPKQNQVSAIPQRSPTTRLTEGETRLGWRTTLNPAPRGKHDNMQNTKLTCRKYIQLIWKSYFKYLKMAKSTVSVQKSGFHGPLATIV